MSITVNDNLQNFSPKSLDNKYTNTPGSVSLPYSSTAEANTKIVSAYRSIGLTVLINNGSENVEYWYKDGILDVDLVLKTKNLPTGTDGNILSLVSGNPTWISSNLYSFSNGLTESSHAVKLGGTLTQSTTIDGTSTYTMLFTGSRSGSDVTVEIANTGSGYALYSHAVNGAGVQGNSTNGSGVNGISVNGIGVIGTSTASAGGQFSNNSTNTNTVETIINLARQTGTAGNGIGGAISFAVEDDSGSGWQTNTLYSKWTNVTHATRTSEFGITGTNSGVSVTHLTISGNGSTKLNAYGSGTFTGTATYALHVDSAGNIIEGAIGGGSYTFTNGLTEISGTVKLGGTLTQDTTITNGTKVLTITGASSPTSSVIINSTSTARVLEVTADTTNTAITGNSVSGVGVQGNATGGKGVYGAATTGVGVTGEATTGVGGRMDVNPSSTNTVVPVLQIRRFSTGSSANGIGGSIDFYNNTTVNAKLANQLVSKWTDVTDATRTSQFILTGVNSAATADLLSISGAGIFTLVQGLSNFANDAAAAGGGIPVNGLYRNGSVVQIRVS